MVKRMVFRLIVMLVIMLGIANYALYLTTGRSPLDFTALWSQAREKAALLDADFESLRPEVESEQDGTTVLKAGKIRVYKWQDASGQWHYGEKPPEGVVHQSMLIDREQNVIAGVRPEPETARPQSEPEADADSPLPSMPYTPENVKKMFEDAKALQGLFEQRAKAQEELLNRP